MDFFFHCISVVSKGWGIDFWEELAPSSLTSPAWRPSLSHLFFCIFPSHQFLDPGPRDHPVEDARMKGSDLALAPNDTHSSTTKSFQSFHN